MMVSDLRPLADERVRFSLRAVPRLSTKSGVYVLSTFYCEILYIGSSCNLKNRMVQHLESVKYDHKSPKGRTYWLYYSSCPSNKCFYMERGWLNHFLLQEGRLPYFNKIRSP